MDDSGTTGSTSSLSSLGSTAGDPALTRRRFLRVAAAGAPAVAVAVAVAVPACLTRDFTHRGHHVRVTHDGRRVTLRIDGRVIPGAVQVRSDGVLASPELLPYSDAEWGTDVRELARRLIDGNGVDYIIF